MLICTLLSGDMDGCMYDMYIGIWWHGQLYVLICPLVSGGKDVVCMLICTLVSCSMYVNMYIGIWWYGRLYVC